MRQQCYNIASSSSSSSSGHGTGWFAASDTTCPLLLLSSVVTSSSSSGSGESLPLFTRGNNGAASAVSSARRRRPYTATANPAAAALAIGCSATGLCAQRPQGQPLFSREPGAAGASYTLAQRPSSREARRPSTGWFRAQPVLQPVLQPVVGQRI